MVLQNLTNLMKNNIIIFTTFRNCSPSYSLNRVVIDQLKMFISHGYNVKVIVAKGFKENCREEWYLKPEVKLIEISDVAVQNDLNAYEREKNFEEDVKLLSNELKEIINNGDIIIAHDIFYQPAAIKHNLAIRRIIKDLPQTKILNWVHSASIPFVLAQERGGGFKYLELVQKPLPNAFHIAFNPYSIPRIASWFGAELSNVKYVPHPYDFTEFFTPLAKDITEKKGLLQADVVCIYPCRLDRGKQPHIVIEIINQIKQMGRTIRLVIADFSSRGGDKVVYKQEMKNMALDFGWTEDELTFVSEFDMPEGQLREEVSHQTISNLFEISNVFILPSRSETYSLVAQEAAMKRNLLILNFDFPAFRSIYGEEARYYKFSSNIDYNTAQEYRKENGIETTETNYTDRIAYMKGIASYILYAQEHTRVLAMFNKLKKTKNLDYVFRHHIEPLLFTDEKYNI